MVLSCLLPAARQAERGEAFYKLEAQTVTQPGRISFHGETDRAVEVERKLSTIL
jgi:hypothetical protein